MASVPLMSRGDTRAGHGRGLTPGLATDRLASGNWGSKVQVALRGSLSRPWDPESAPHGEVKPLARPREPSDRTPESSGARSERGPLRPGRGAPPNREGLRVVRGGRRKALPTKQEPQWSFSGGAGGAGRCRASHRTPTGLGWWATRTGVGGGASRGGPPPRPAMVAGVAHTTGGSSAVRTPASYPTRAPRPFGPGGSQCRSGKSDRGTGRPPGGAANEPWKERSFQGRLAAPPRPTRPRGSTTTGRDRIDALGRRLRQAGDVGWIANEADPGGGGRSRSRPAWRLATIHATKGAPGDRPGAANEP